MLPLATSGQVHQPPLKRDDYPSIKYWYDHEWKAFVKANSTITDPNAAPPQRGSTRASQGINVTMQYVEDDNGEAVEGYRTAAMRHRAHALFARLYELKIAPSRWGEARSDILAAYITEMEDAFPELRRSADSWKALKIATDTYPSWRRNHVRRHESEGRGQDDSDESVSPGPNAVSRKRAASAHPSRPAAITQKKFRQCATAVPVHASLPEEPSQASGSSPASLAEDSALPSTMVMRHAAQEPVPSDVSSSRLESVQPTTQPTASIPSAPPATEFILTSSLLPSPITVTD
ncbi:hypothetical protein C8Q80DRAFT_1273010 [Daedaleopsis nitida]|nr:hypothetical protein C8Q80DRAFT_1273010 [Daedaleopsis nitida]